MSEEFPMPIENHLGRPPTVGGSSPERVLKNFRYVAASVNNDALCAWAELWKELEPIATASGQVLPDVSSGYTPSCGWPEFLEKFWLLKHYLDYTHRLCQET